MDLMRTPKSSCPGGVIPKKSPTAEAIQRRRQEINQSEKAAYWAIFNLSMAIFLYYDLCYLQTLEENFLIVTEWLVCILFTISACYDLVVHFWPYTLMKPITIAPNDSKLLGIDEDEFGFKVEDSSIIPEPICDKLPPFEIQNSFDEEDKVATPPKHWKKGSDSRGMSQLDNSQYGIRNNDYQQQEIQLQQQTTTRNSNKWIEDFQRERFFTSNDNSYRRISGQGFNFSYSNDSR